MRTTSPCRHFVSRLFRHSAVYIRTDRGIAEPEDLKGKSIGLPEYQITAISGSAASSRKNTACSRATSNGGAAASRSRAREERAKIKLPDDIDLKPIPAHRTLSEMLAAGELDGMISARAPSCFVRGAPKSARLFPDYPSDRGGLFPQDEDLPDHARDRHPPLASGEASVARGELYKAFLRAKEHVMHELEQSVHLARCLAGRRI